jgi:1A family penicillin-binding protein
VPSLGSRILQLSHAWRRLQAEHPKVLERVLLGTTLAVTAAFVGFIWFIASLRSGLPSPDALGRIGEMDQATAVYDGSDQLAFTIFKEQRIDVPLEQVSPNLVKAVIAIEDQRFYEHSGFNMARIGIAALANLRHRRVAQGGSTITQQLARLSFLTPDKTLRRKIQELILARRIESSYTKPQILELYLNKVYFGDGLYGVEAASRGYFGKPAHDLSLAEAALLAGLVKSPSTYAPTVKMDRAVARRNVVLQVMHEIGAINDADWKDARSTKIVLQDALRAEEPWGLYFKEQVRQELVARFGWERVYEGGLRVYSTVNMATQLAAETAIAAGLKSIEARRASIAAKRKAASAPEDQSAPLQAALIAMEPDTGFVRAMVGGRDFDESHFNRAVQAKRQPGSAFKPFVYAAALEVGYTPATVIQNLNAPIATLQGAWTPEDEHSAADSMSLRTALRTSSNRAAVRLLQQVGIPKTVQYAKTMGVGNLPSVPSLALGSGDVTLQSMTAAYAGFDNHGDVPRPLLIRRVEDRNGQLLYESTPSATHAISPQTAFLMTTMMADVINAGTGARARSLGFTLPAAGKTGTTNDFNDAWFIGFTPSLVAGVWVGFDQPRTILPNGFAAEVAVPIWANFMKAATKGDKPVGFPAPSGIVTATVCRLSGKLAAEGCNHAVVLDDDGEVTNRSMVYTEYFARGTEPTALCNLHPMGGFTGAVATVFAPTEKPAPVHIEPTRPPAAVVADAAHEPPPPRAESEPPKKKRGFWGRIFGGRDRANNDKKARQQ